jgi:CheY-like chemotaxis protein
VNCFDLALQIRRVKLNVPIIMTTSDNVPGDQTMSRQLGIGGYIVEPVRRGELLRLVCGVLGEAGVEKQGRGAILDVAPNDAENICPVQILIADDSEDNRFLMQEYLAHTSSKITFVENGEQAVHMAQSQQFDLIFMDIHMPVMDGLTATKLIRRAEQEAGGGQIPVLALTAGACKEDIEACRAAGCSAHISKPISKEKILSSINKYVQRIEPPKTPYPSLTNIPLGRETAAKRYTERRKAEVSCLVRLLEERDFAHLRTLAHNMKGTGKPYGFPEITRIGAALEDAAKQRDAVGIDQHLAALSAYLERASMNVASGDITRHTIARSVSTEMLSTACVDGTPRPADVS